MSEREIPESVMAPFLAAMGWADYDYARDLAAKPIRAVIDAWEAWEALPIVDIRHDEDGWIYYCRDTSRRCLESHDKGIGTGYTTEEAAREAGVKHLADIHDGQGRLP